MSLKSIKELTDKTPVASVSGIVEKQYAPAEQTENDKKFSQHRQSFLINDGEEKLMVTLMKSQLHILDSIEGHELVLTAGINEKGEKRGLLLNKWRPADSKYDKVSVKVYPEATIRAVSPEDDAPTASPAQVSNNSPKEPTPSSTMSEASQFEKHLALCSHGLSLCLDKAEEMVASREHLQKDPENVRAIAISMFIDTKHHLNSLAPGLKGGKTQSRGQEPGKTTPPAGKSANPIERCMKALSIFELKGEEGMSSKAVKAMNDLVEQVDNDDGWDKAYDILLEDFQKGNSPVMATQVAAAADVVFDSCESPSPERYFVSHPAKWRELVLEQIGRDEA